MKRERLARETFTITLSGRAASLLRSLVATQLFGKSEVEVVERLVLEALRRLFPKAVQG